MISLPVKILFPNCLWVVSQAGKKTFPKIFQHFNVHYSKIFLNYDEPTKLAQFNLNNCNKQCCIACVHIFNRNDHNFYGKTNEKTDNPSKKLRHYQGFEFAQNLHTQNDLLKNEKGIDK